MCNIWKRKKEASVFGLRGLLWLKKISTSQQIKKEWLKKVPVRYLLLLRTLAGSLLPLEWCLSPSSEDPVTIYVVVVVQCYLHIFNSLFFDRHKAWDFIDEGKKILVFWLSAKCSLKTKIIEFVVEASSLFQSFFELGCEDDSLSSLHHQHHS